MDGTTKAKPEGHCGVNCQTSVGLWERFIVAELTDGLNRAELEELIANYGPLKASLAETTSRHSQCLQVFIMLVYI